MLKVPTSLRQELKKPFGNLYKSVDLIQNILNKQLSADKLIIGIGDVTTRNLINIGIEPQISIVDNKIERTPVQHKLDHTTNIKNVINPAGIITDKLTDTIKEAIMKKEKIIIVVDGEEDLAVIPCILNSPKDTMILYGQPHEGIVLVNVEKTYKKAEEIQKQLIKE